MKKAISIIMAFAILATTTFTPVFADDNKALNQQAVLAGVVQNSNGDY